jgi:hypothetical protein
MTKRRSTVQGHSLVNHIQKLLASGDVRRICILDQERSILEIPVNLGDPAAPASMLKAPLLAAIKAFGTLTDECIVEVEIAEKES